MAEDYSTSEARAFREHYDKLVDSIQEPDLPVLGARFFSRQIISRDTMEMVGNATASRAVRASKLMLAVMAVLETHPDKIESVLDVFRKEPVYAQFSSLIKEACDNGQLPSHERALALPKPMSEYARYLRSVYRRSKLPIKREWPPSPCNKIIKLAIIHRDNSVTPLALSNIEEYMQENSMSPVSMDDILQPRDGSLPKVVAVQGVPGIGKSTFAWKFCRRWAKGKIYQPYDLVVLLRMRDTRVREAKKLSDLFFSEDEEFSKQVAKEIIAREGKNILIVMEGIDELPASCLADDTLLSNLLQGKSLPEVTIIVTTRPWAVQMLIEMCGEQISRQIEILGFTKEDISIYVSHAFADQEEKTEFLEYLHSHPQLESIMHIPLNAAFVVQIFKQFKRSQQAIPHTLTQLYTALVSGLLLRYIKFDSAPDFSELKIAGLEDLPEPTKTKFKQLCLLAFKSFTKLSVQVTFTDSEAALYECLDSLGLMQSSVDLSINTGTTVTHSFLHFTIQEFLAAYHLSKLPAQVQKLFLEIHKNDKQIYMLSSFFFGLKHDILSEVSTFNGGRLSTIQLHWLFETQSPKAVCEYLGTGEVEYESYKVTSYDFHALIYCLCHSHCKWKIGVFLSSVSLQHLTSESDDSYNGQILVLTIVDVASSGLHKIFSLPKRLFTNLQKLRIFANHDCDDTVAGILKGGLLSRSSLTGFNYGCINLSTTCLTPITATSETLCTLFPKLRGIGFFSSLITSSDMLQLCQYITSPSCPSKLELALSGNIFSEDSLQMLISAVACSKSLGILYLPHNQISLANMEMLSVALSTNSTLKILKLHCCLIDGEKAELLASALEENKALVELDVHDNNINANGAAALGSMLEVNTSLKKLDLSKNTRIGTEGALRLINALEQNKTLSELILPSECEPIEYGSILFEQIRRKNRVSFIAN